jgi:glycopeptide antibiotics resistance protein
VDDVELRPARLAAHTWRRLLRSALVAYLGVLLLLTFAPIDTNPDAPILRTQVLRTIRHALRHAPWSLPFALLVGNLVAFAPLGVLVPLLVRRRVAGLALAVLLLAFLLSLGIETGQVLVSSALGYAYRTADVDDVILNVTGALIGYALFAAVTTLVAWRRRRTA